MRRPLFPLIALALAACSQTPELQVPDMALPTAWGEVQETTIPAPAAWWALFNSAELDRLEPVAVAAEPVRPRIERYAWPLAAALALALAAWPLGRRGA